MKKVKKLTRKNRHDYIYGYLALSEKTNKFSERDLLIINAWLEAGTAIKDLQDLIPFFKQFN